MIKTAINKKHKGGFTLIELLVSISIFVIFLGVVSLSYIGIVRSQRQANDVRKMYSDVRTFVESLSQDMRLGTVDYDCYKSGSVTPGDSLATNPCPFSTILDPQGSTASSSPYLAIVNKDRTQKVVYWFDQTEGKLKVKRYERGGSSDQVDIAQWTDAPGYASGDEGADPQNGSRVLFSDLVTVKQLVFAVNPPVNPYEASNYDKNQYQFQPKVTMTMYVENANPNVPPFHLRFQTTLSSRVYSRAS